MKTPDQVISTLKAAIDKVNLENGPHPFSDGPEECGLNYKELLYELYNLEPDETVKVLEDVFKYRENESLGPVIASWLAEDLDVVLDIKY